MKKNSSKQVHLPENWGQMSEMDRRSFLEWSLKLTALMALAPALEPEAAHADTYNNRPSRFVNFFIRGGSCQLSSYLSPTANISNLSSLPSSWKTPGIATSFRPSTPAKAAEENVDYCSLSDYGKEAQGSQPLFHARTQIGSFFMPILWDSQIPVGTGTGVDSMRRLIQTNCALIYGLESAPAHPLAENMLLDPEPGNFTIGGYISAMAGTAFFPAIANTGGVRPYKNLSGSGLRIFQADASSGGPALDLMRSVIPIPNEVSGNSGRRAWFDQMRTKMLQSVESIRITNMISRPGISELYHMMTQAQTAVDSGLYTQVITDFTTTLAKYQAILNRAKTMATTNIRGISDAATIATNPPVVTRSTLRMYEGATSGKQSISAIASLFSQGALVASDSFAYIFALAEVALRNNLTRVLQLGLGEGMVTLRHVVQGNSPVLAGGAFDNHERGAVSNLISNAAFYYIFNTLLYELRRNICGITSSPGTLTNSPIAEMPRMNDLWNGVPATPAPPSPNPWRDTFILVNTEFARNPNARGDGSQHGYNGSCAALFSGRIAGNLQVVGRTTYGTAGNGYGDYPGAWGRGSVQMNLTNGRQVSYKDLGASLAALYGLGPSIPRDLTTLLQRSESLLGLDSSGNLTFGNKLPSYGLVST
jgi:hypothetical protein